MKCFSNPFEAVFRLDFIHQMSEVSVKVTGPRDFTGGASITF